MRTAPASAARLQEPRPVKPHLAGFCFNSGPFWILRVAYFGQYRRPGGVRISGRNLNRRYHRRLRLDGRLAPSDVRSLGAGSTGRRNTCVKSRAFCRQLRMRVPQLLV